MTGGSLHLSSFTQTGQDIININPQITYFKTVYKRHTNFGRETIEQNFRNIPDFNSTNTLFIQKTGSLITDMYIDFKLPPVVLQGTNGGIISNYNNYAHYVNNVSHALIDEISLYISNNLIDKHTGVYLDVLNELYDVNKKEWPLLGKYDDSQLVNKELLHNTRYTLPLKFYFNQNEGLGIPIFLLEENSVKIDIKLKSLNSLLKFEKTGTTTITDKSIIDFKFYTTYIFLEKDEECKIKSNMPNEYLIETVDIFDNLTETELSQISLNNPVKELIWIFRHNDRLLEGSVTNDPKHTLNITHTNRNDIFNYSNNSIKTANYDNYDTFGNLTIYIGNNEAVKKVILITLGLINHINIIVIYQVVDYYKMNSKNIYIYIHLQ